MDEGQIFIENMLAAMRDQGMTEAELSKKSGLNRRAVTDLREGRVKSPKLSTVFSIAQALNLDPGEMMGLGPRSHVQADLAEYLAQYDKEGQQQILQALRAIRG